MKIVHCVESYYPAVGGMQEVVKQLSERLVKLNHQVIALTRYHEERTFTQLNGVEIVQFRIEENPKIVTTQEEQRYVDYLLNLEADVITFFAAQQWATDLALPHLKQINAKKVSVPTGYSGLYKEEFKQYFEDMRNWIHGYDMNVYLSNDYRDINFARENKVSKIMYDYRGAADAFKASTIKLDLDMAPPVFGLTPGPVLEIIGSKQMMWPGYDLPDDVSYQFVEREYLLADEYDDFLEDPGDFVWRKLLPRVGTLFEPLSALPHLRLMAGGNAVLQLGMAVGASPELDATFSRFSVLGAETAKYMAVTSELTAELEAAGYPVVAATATLCPFDWVSDMLRGIRGVMLDMYRCPDKLLAAVDLYTDVTIESTIGAARDSGNPRVFIPLHRGAGGFMSNDQYAKFYWPSLKKMLLAFVDAGLVPLPFWEGNYTPRLEFLAELPLGKIVGHFDVVDTKKFKAVLGDTMCFWGDVPASLLCTGLPAEVRDYVRRLIDLFADTGGLIVDGATGGIPYNARPENVEAMVGAAHDYGVY